MRRLLLVALLALAARAQEDEDPVGFTVAGTVVDAEGGPVAGLLVQAWDALAPDRFLTQAETGPKGRFLAVFRRSATRRRGHAFGPVLLVVRGQGIAQARRRVAAGTRGFAIAVRPSVAARGVVEDAEGRPVPAAIVRGGAGAVVEETTTGEDGRFVLTQFASERVPITASYDGIVAEPFELRPDKMRRLRFFRLPETVRAKGRVLAAGEPVADARLVLGARDLAVTDRAGAFELTVARGGGRFEVHAPGFFVQPCEVGAGDGNEIVLEPAAAVKGHVVDAEDAPLSGCRVTLDPPGAGAWTDDRGNFRFEVVARGMMRLRVTRPGYLDASVRVNVGTVEDDLTLRLERGTRVGGRVLRDGEPMLGARVEARRADGSVAGAVYSDPQGRFLFDGVPPGSARLLAIVEGLRSEGSPLAKARPHRLELRETLRLFGTLRSDTGAPLEGAAVSCTVGEEERSVRADAGGRFDFRQVPVAEYELSVEAPDHAPVSFRAWPGEPVARTVESRYGARTLHVTVVVPLATPMRLVLERREDPRVRRVSGAPEAVFAGLPPGPYRLTVEAEGFLDERTELEIGDADPEPLVLSPRRGGSLRLVATPGAAVAVQGVRGKPPPVVALRLAEGTKELRGFGPGLYRFIARAKGELIVVKQVELGPNTPPRELDLRGGEEATLTVTVKDRTGTPLDAAEVTLVSEAGFEWKTGKQTGAGGTLALDRLFQGRMEVHVRRGNRAGQAALDVEPGAAMTLTVVVR